MKKFNFVILMLSLFSIEAQTVWSGPNITFTKSNFADWNQEVNQDRLSNNVWITRKNSQGIFNIAQETGWAGASISPVDTEWAIGTTADIATLTFDKLHPTVGGSLGNNLVGLNLVMHLITDDIYLDISFTSWTNNGSGGGFSYERSTPSTLSSQVDFELMTPEINFNYNTKNLTLQDVNRKSNLNIYDVTGRIVVDKAVSNRQQIIDLSFLTNGIYFARLDSTSSMLKFIIN